MGTIKAIVMLDVYAMVQSSIHSMHEFCERCLREMVPLPKTQLEKPHNIHVHTTLFSAKILSETYVMNEGGHLMTITGMNKPVPSLAAEIPSACMHVL